MAEDGCPAASGCNHYHALLYQGLDHRQLDDRPWCRAPDHAAEVPVAVLADDVPLGFELTRMLRRELATDELRGIEERRVVGVDFDLGDDRRHASIAVVAAQRILDRLLDHVADPAGRGGDQDAERQRRGLASSNLVSHELIADLRAVAMHDADAPAGKREIDDR